MRFAALPVHLNCMHSVASTHTQSLRTCIGISLYTYVYAHNIVSTSGWRSCSPQIYSNVLIFLSVTAIIFASYTPKYLNLSFTLFMLCNYLFHWTMTSNNNIPFRGHAFAGASVRRSDDASKRRRAASLPPKLSTWRWTAVPSRL